MKDLSIREQLIKTLAYPRYFVRNRLDLEDCPHSGFYAPGTKECLECDYEEECRWLFENEEFAALTRKPMSQLLEAVEFASAYIDARAKKSGHRVHRCHCVTCTWLREAQVLFDACVGCSARL
ncbi:MAG: hypothetical protein ACE5K1_03565 [Acidiferrobacterales bacterium]